MCIGQIYKGTIGAHIQTRIIDPSIEHKNDLFYIWHRFCHVNNEPKVNSYLIVILNQTHEDAVPSIIFMLCDKDDHNEYLQKLR